MKIVLVDIYRIVFLAEVVSLAGMYIWALLAYRRALKQMSDRGLRCLYVGVICRCIAVVSLLLLIAVQLASSFGADSVGALLANVMIQIVITFFGLAWWLVDFRRFQVVEVSTTEFAAQAMERIEKTKEKLSRETPPEDRRRRRATDMPVRESVPE